MADLIYTVVLLPEPEGEFTVEVPALSGCFSRGLTITEALRNAEEAIHCHVQALRELGQEIPRESGQVVVDTQELTEALLFKVGIALETARVA